VHRTAAAGRLFDDDTAGRTKRGEAKFRALWASGRKSGSGVVELRPAGKATSMLVVTLHATTQFGRVFGSRMLNKMSDHFGLALVYEIEKNLKEHGEKLDSALKGRIEESLGKLREALKGEDAAAITVASEAVQQVWHEAAATLYQSAEKPSAEPGPGPEAGGEAPKKPGAVDADFEVMN